MGEKVSVKYGKRDANHSEIRDAAERTGAGVFDTAGAGPMCPGLPDLLVLVPWAPIPDVRAVEIKVGNAKLTPAEAAFKDKWERYGGIYHIWRTVDDVLRDLGINGPKGRRA